MFDFPGSCGNGRPSYTKTRQTIVGYKKGQQCNSCPTWLCVNNHPTNLRFDPPSLDMLHRHVFFAHFLLTNNGLCRLNCLCHQQWYLHLSHSVSLLGSFFRLAFLYLYLYLHLSLSLSLSHSLTFSLFIIFQSFELFYAQHLRHSLCYEFVSAKMFGINHVSYTSSGVMVPRAPLCEIERTFRD